MASLAWPDRAKFLADGGALKPDLTASEAVDILWLLNDPASFTGLDGPWLAAAVILPARQTRPRRPQPTPLPPLVRAS
jgi:hypothetical protein